MRPWISNSYSIFAPDALTAGPQWRASFAMNSANCNVLPHWRSGKLRVLAVATKRRSTQIPDVPTLAESGLPDYEVNAWYGIAAPAGTPTAIVDRLHAEMMKFVGTPAYRDALAAQGAEPVSSTPAEFAEVLRADKANWSRILKELGIRGD